MNIKELTRLVEQLDREQVDMMALGRPSRLDRMFRSTAVMEEPTLLQQIDELLTQLR